MRNGKTHKTRNGIEVSEHMAFGLPVVESSLLHGIGWIRVELGVLLGNGHSYNTQLLFPENISMCINEVFGACFVCIVTKVVKYMYTRFFYVFPQILPFP